MDLALRADPPRRLPLGRARRADEPRSPSATSGRSTATRSCSSGVNLDVAERRVRHDRRRRPAAARPRSCACCWARSAPTRGSILIDGEPLPAEPGPGPRRRLPALLGVPASDGARATSLLGLEFDARTAARAGCSARPARSAVERGRRPCSTRSASAMSHGHVSGAALGRHAAAAGHRPGADPQAARSCCSTSRSARSIPASAATCTS